MFDLKAYLGVILEKIDLLPIGCTMDINAMLLVSIIEWQDIGPVPIHHREPADLRILQDMFQDRRICDFLVLLSHAMKIIILYRSSAPRMPVPGVVFLREQNPSGLIFFKGFFEEGVSFLTVNIFFDSFKDYKYSKYSLSTYSSNNTISLVPLSYTNSGTFTTIISPLS